MGQDEYVFDDAQNSKAKKSALAGIGGFIWNSRTKEFCGRDGASWGKVSLFYAIFYFCLGSFFIGMLAVFIQIMPKDKPTYYGETSVMNTRGYSVNPGLGFRPQLDVEDALIYYNPEVLEDAVLGHKKFAKSLNNFLHAKYPKESDNVDAIDCAFNQSYVEDLKQNKYCKFDYAAIFADSECTADKDFGYQTDKPCVLIKLNKIVSWTPQSSSGYISIQCYGETAVDVDNIREVTYYSEGNVGATEGRLQTKYYPFYAQKNYQAPFVWARFDVTPNTLVNVECKAVADNIDYERLNKRGLTKFALFVSNKK